MMLLTYLLFTMCVPLVVSINQENCTHLDFVPGYNFGGEGFDIVTMQRKTSNIIDMETFINDDGSCQVYQNTQLKGNPRQKVPSSITTWKVRNVGSQEIVSEMYSSTSDYSHRAENYVSSSWSIGLGFDASGLLNFGLSGGFVVKGSHSTMSQYIREEGRLEQSLFVEHALELQQYEYSLAAANIPLQNNFVQALNELPCSYSSEGDRLAFQTFLDEFGTHVINKVTLGGRVKAVTIIHTCDLTRFGRSAREIAKSMAFEASLNLGIFKIDGGHRKDEYKNDSAEARMNYSSIFNIRKYDIIGGDAMAISDVFFSQNEKKKYQNWMSTINTKPDVINYSVKPIFVMLEQANPSGVKNIRERIRSLKMATEAYLYEKRKSAEGEICTEVCEFKCPYSGKMNDNCGCMCSPNKDSDENCCPKKIGIGTLTIKDIRAEDLEEADITSKADSWVETVNFFPFKKTGTKVEDDNPKWSNVWKMGEQQAGTQVCLKIKDKDFLTKTDLIAHCCHTLDATNTKFECHGKSFGRLYATIDFKCYEYYSGAMCDRYDRQKINKTPKGVCLKSVLNLNQYILNHTCLDPHAEDLDLNAKIGQSGFMIMTICFGGLLVVLIVVVAIVMGVRKHRMKKRSCGLLVQSPESMNYGTHNNAAYESW